MKTLLILASLIVSPQCYAFFDVMDLFQYPEDRPYTAADRGIAPYRALSVYKTGTFALTFDDGPHPTITAKVLDVLKQRDVKAVFFVLTSKVTQATFPLLKRMLDEGHIVASHGVTHDRSPSLTREQFKAMVKQSFLDLAQWYRKAGHAFDKFFYRFPYGSYGYQQEYHHINVLKEISQELMGDNCLQMAFWDVDTADWVPGMTPAEVAGNIKAFNEGGTFIDFKRQGSIFVKNPVQIKNPTAGGVILQHDVHELTPKAVKLALDYAHQANLRVVRLDEISEFAVTKKCVLP